MTLSIDTLYGDWDTSDAEFQALLDELPPARGPSRFLERLSPLNPGPSTAVIDVGCGTGADARQIHRSYGASVVGIDPVQRHLNLANARMKRQVASGALRFAAGSMATLPLAADTANIICCRDVLMHVPNLDAGFAECRRVARTGATMLVSSVVATSLLTETEAEPLYAALAVHPSSMTAPHIEAAARGTQWRIQQHERIGSEWAEADAADVGYAQLKRVSQLLRERDFIIDRVGPRQYEVELQLARWRVFPMLGKLEHRVWQLIAV